MRLLNQGTGLLSLERLGMPARMMEKVRSALNRSSGMILVTGPTGSGKTTALYAALNEINSPDRKIITVEDRSSTAHRHQPGAGARQDRTHVRARVGARPCARTRTCPRGRNARPHDREIGLRAA